MVMSQFQHLPNTPENIAEWSYAMRRDMQEIIPGLFLGPYSAANKSKLIHLKGHGVTHIVCIRDSVDVMFVKPNLPEHFKYLILAISDHLTENIIQHLPKVKQFIDECLQSHGKVLVHGNAGISRSAALVIGYIMERFGLTYNDALQHVQQRRFCVNPNEAFVQQLKEYEPIYRAKMLFENGQSSMDKGLFKRKLSDSDMVEQQEDEGMETS